MFGPYFILSSTFWILCHRAVVVPIQMPNMLFIDVSFCVQSRCIFTVFIPRDRNHDPYMVIIIKTNKTLD